MLACLVDGNDTEILTICRDEADLWRMNIAVNAILFVGGYASILQNS
jgi:hypothetical protein